jgi:RNA polymerase sigma factor (sigma-70 family)
LTAVPAYLARDSTPATTDSNWSAITATDGELLMRFTRHRDGAAFAQIVERHAGLVWIVCRETLGHHQDVEDAFQATFFILAEQAAKIRSCDSAAAWLYKVAQRTSLAARRKRAQRREEELAAELPHDGGSERLIHDQQMIYVLMEELRGLPERYRTPLVLRYLEGRTRRTIAAQTDSTLPQVQGRLVRGRRLLRSRMARRGVSLSLASGVMAGLVAEAGAAVPAPLAIATAKSCVSLVAAGAASGTSVAAIELAKQGIKAMWLASFMKSSSVVSAVFVVAGVAWAVESGAGGGHAGANTAPGVSVIALENNAQISGTSGDAGITDVKVDDFHFVNDNQASAKEAYERLITTRLDKSQAVLRELIAEKAEKTADLEMRQLEKSLVQRNLERLNEKLNELKTQSLTDSANDKDERENVLKLGDRIAAQISAMQSDLMKTTQDTAKMAADLEMLQIDLQRKQRRLEALDRLSEQLQNEAQFTPALKKTTISVVKNDVDQNEVGKLGPRDTIRISVRNAFPDSPLADDYTIEPMGTVALGPVYGRVNVKGMTVLEAEEAIKKHLAKIIEDPQLQVTLSEKQSSVRDLQNLESVVEKLRAESNDLQKQLDELRRRPTRAFE